MRYWKDWRRHGVAVIAVLLLLSPALRAQSDEIQDVSGAANPKAQPAGRALPAFPSDAAGEGTIALEGFYLTGSAQAATNASGLAVNVKEYLPGIGVLDAAVDGSVGSGLHTGTKFVALEQTPFLGWHWDLVAGDSQVSSNLREIPPATSPHPTFRRAAFAWPSSEPIAPINFFSAATPCSAASAFPTA